MENSDNTEEEKTTTTTVSNDSTGNGTETATEEQHMDFSTEIMSVTEMEQSPDSSPDLNEENAQEEGEIPNIESLQTTDIEAGFPPDFDKFWKVVEDNHQDFTGWVYLLQYVEQEVSMCPLFPQSSRNNQKKTNQLTYSGNKPRTVHQALIRTVLRQQLFQ